MSRVGVVKKKGMGKGKRRGRMGEGGEEKHYTVHIPTTSHHLHG